jgi:dienelactone hydrolase
MAGDVIKERAVLMILKSESLVLLELLILSLAPVLMAVAPALTAETATATERISESPTAESKAIWDLRQLSRAPRVFPAPTIVTNDMQSLFFEGPVYQGRPTRVFAWMGIPRRSGQAKIPGMVLVHGGGGTAFDAWVRLWNQRGYAAIAMDTCGCLPGGDHGKRPRHEWGGPPGWGGFDQISEPQTDQWTYHAVASVILANSLLRDQPGVDAKRIGLTGISWGGYLTCIAAGIDSRFRFAVPVYGCGYYQDTVFRNNLDKLGDAEASKWLAWWDPSSVLANARMPILWVTGSSDFAYSLEALQRSYRLPRTPRTLCVRVGMPHGHGGPGESPREIQVFADSILNRGIPLMKIKAQGRHGSEIWAEFNSQRPIIKAELNFTRDTGPWPARVWQSIPARISRDRVSSHLPEDARVYYLNLFDDRDCVVSTEHELSLK